MEKHDLVGFQLVSLGDRVRLGKGTKRFVWPQSREPSGPLGGALEGGLLGCRNSKNTRVLGAMF
jgi:hypothetical protein